MNKEKWEALLKEFWQSEYAPDEASLREGLIVKSFAEFCMVKEAAQQNMHADGACICPPKSDDGHMVWIHGECPVHGSPRR